VTACLLVRSGERQVALPLDALEQIVALDVALPAPGLVPAVRGVVAVRGGFAPLAHLAALLERRAAPQAAGMLGVVVGAGGRRVVLEVDETIDLLREAREALPPGWGVGWASEGVRRAGRLIPVVEVAALFERLEARRAEATA
jgi:chemotaxis protein histidine kinase CheA